MVAQHIFRNRRGKFGITADLSLLVIQAERGKVLREAFVEPSLGGRVVVIKEQVSELVGDGAPGIFLRYVQHDELVILAGNEKSWLGDGTALLQWGHLQILLFIVKGEDREWDGHRELLAHQKLSKDGAHLLEAQRDLAALLVARVADHHEVLRTKLLPLGFSGLQG